VTESRLEKKSGPVGKTDPQRKEVIWSFSFVDKTVARFSILARRQSDKVMKFKHNFKYLLMNHRPPDEQLRRSDDWNSFINLALEVYFHAEPIVRKTIKATTRKMNKSLVWGKSIEQVSERHAGPLVAQLTELFEEYVIFQTANVGGEKMRLSTTVQLMLREWKTTRSGLTKLARFDEANLESLRVLRGLRPAPIRDGDWYRGTNEAVQELKKLFERWNGHAATTRRRLSRDEMMNWFKDNVEPVEFPILHLSRESFFHYLNSNGDNYGARLARSAEFSEDDFFLDWMSKRTGRPPQQVRKLISGIGNSKHLIQPS
jgi:hypothetical protein